MVYASNMLWCIVLNYCVRGMLACQVLHDLFSVYDWLRIFLVGSKANVLPPRAGINSTAALKVLPPLYF